MIAEVCLEVGPTGRCMVHVPAFPGCFSVANSRAEALSTVPDAICSYILWLARHGEQGELPDTVEVRLVEEVSGYGPFNPGDKAGLFAWDKQPLDRDEMEQLIRRAGYNRAALLRTTEGLTDDELDRRRVKGEMTIREVLRHIGNAEQWYISRIVDPHTLPKEWTDDESMPTFDFLEMERRTAIERLRQLTDDERAAVFYPSRWTKYPDEGWTARKVLRRMLEHEREHYHQIRELIRDRVSTWTHW